MNLGTLLIKLGKAEKTRAVVVDLGEGPDPSPPPPLFWIKVEEFTEEEPAGQAKQDRVPLLARGLNPTLSKNSDTSAG